MSPAPLFTNGVYTPLATPFLPNEDIDFPAFEHQVLRLAQAGMGLVVLGTNGEASHCSDQERVALTRAARKVLDANGFEDRPLLVGTGTGSARETVRLSREAHEAGASHAIVIFPGYFNFALKANLKQAIKEFFIAVFEGSPVPVMVYNFPGAVSGIDLDSDLISELSNHPNCFGVKLTCGSCSKGLRIALHTQSASYLATHAPFQVLPGFADYLLPALLARQTGCITGTGNLIPKTIVKLYDTAVEAIATGDRGRMEEAQRLQDLVSQADWVIIKGGIAGTKYALDKYVKAGLGGAVRKPLPAVDAGVQALVDGDVFAKAMEYENSL